MTAGLPVSDVVNVQMVISPLAAAYRNFGIGLIVGGSDVIDTSERIRQYSSIAGVAGDFSNNTPEYLAAVRYFSQVPQPSIVYIGRWANAATSATLHGGVLSASDQTLSNWTAITSGGFKITVDGVLKSLTALNFSAATNLNGVAAIIDAALTGASVIWDATNGRFAVESGSTGTSSTLTYASAPASGTDISAQLKLTTGLASAPVAGIASETLVSALQAFANVSGSWYAAIIAATLPSDSDMDAAAAYIEASNKSRMLGYTTQATTAIDATQTSDLPSKLKAAAYRKTFGQYSSFDGYAIASFFGRAATVNFDGSKTTLTMKFKTEPGITAETLTEAQAASLTGKNLNSFVNYDNQTAIIQQGVMANGYFFDEVHGLDWLQNRIQTDVWNLLYTSATKIPQTDAGSEMIANVIEQACEQAVINGLAAPGVWNADGFGQLARGDMLTRGYYVWYPPISTQSQADREARISVPFQVALKLAGAVHFANITVNVNR